MPRLGDVPGQMHAQLIRPERYGDPQTAFAVETVATPRPGPGEVLVYVMAAGVNYNNVWAALGVPSTSSPRGRKPARPRTFHIGGSDASGIVWAVGEGVDSVRVGDDVVAHCGMWDPNDPWIAAGGDPMIAPSARIWGYETNWGSFAQYTLVQAHQLLPKPPQPELGGRRGVHAGRRDRVPHALLVASAHGPRGRCRADLGRLRRTRLAGDPDREGQGRDPGRGDVGSGARPVLHRARRARLHRPARVLALGRDPELARRRGVRRMDRRVRARSARRSGTCVGERRNPRIVFEHPGEDTIPTSIFVCENGGMVVICAGTTGYHAAVDLRYLWMRQKRLQGSHFAND